MIRNNVSHGISVLAMAVCVLSSDASHAGANAFTPIGPDGGTIDSVAIDPNNPALMYAALPPGFYRSMDAGASWSLAVSRIPGNYFRPTGVAVDPSSSNNVYLIAGYPFYSSDRGATIRGTFSPVGSASASLHVTPTKDGSAAYVSAGAEVYKSTDHGVLWTLSGRIPNVPADVYLHPLQVHPTNPLIVYAAGYEIGVYRSVDGGATWQNIYAPAPASSGADNVWSFTADPLNASRLWLGTASGLRVSNNSGSSWQATSLTGSISGITVDPANASIVYAFGGGAGGLSKSVNGGTSWAYVPGPSRFSNRLIVDPRDSNHLYVYGPDSGLIVSNNAGATWNRADSGLIATTPWTIGVTASGRMYVPVNGKGLFSIASDGRSVSAVLNPTLSFIGGNDPPEVAQVIGVSAAPEYVIALLNNQRIARSENGVGPWQAATTSVPTSVQIFGIGGSGRSPNVYAATSGGIYRSVDFGDHWSLSNVGIPSGAEVWGIKTAGSGAQLFASVHESQNSNDWTVYKSSDDGSSWSPLAKTLQGPTDLYTSPVDPLVVYASTNDGLSRSVDGGTTWDSVPSLIAVLCCHPRVAFDRSNSQVHYIGTHSAIFRSVDRGSTYQLRVASDDYEVIGLGSFVVNPSNSNQFIASTDFGGVREFSISPALSVAMSITSPGGSSAGVGQRLSFDVVARNTGLVDASNARVEVQFPGAFTNPTATTAGGTCVVAGTLVTCTYNPLATNANVSIQLQATVNAPGTLRATAHIVADQPYSAMTDSEVTITVPTPRDLPDRGGDGSTPVALLVGLILLAIARARRKRPAL